MPYFNYITRLAETGFERWEFMRSWQRLAARDEYWAPPHTPTLRRVLRPQRAPHFERLSPRLLLVEAMPRRRHPHDVRGLPAHAFPTAVMEQPVATAVLLHDPRRHDRTATVALLQTVNDETTFRYLQTQIEEQLQALHIPRYIGPVGLSPHLGSGVLLDQWHLASPWHTAGNQPFLPELLDKRLRPLPPQRLYTVPVPTPPAAPTGPAQLTPLDPTRLATDLLPLWRLACTNPYGFPLPDAMEAAFLLDWLHPYTLSGWTAVLNDLPVGFVLVQPDLGPLLARLGGARRWWQRPLWRLLQRRPAVHGRLLFGAVHADYRQRGIGRQLLQAALQMAQQQGWRTLSAGPLPLTGTAVSLLESAGAEAAQTIGLYEGRV